MSIHKIEFDAAADHEWVELIVMTANEINIDPTVQSYKIE